MTVNSFLSSGGGSSTLIVSLNSIRSNINGLESSVQTLQNDVSVNESDITTLQSNVQTLQSSVPREARGIYIPFYTYPSSPSTNPDIAAVNAAAKQLRGNYSVVVIINPASGPGTTADSNYTDALTLLRSGGAFVVGYVATGFGSRAPENVIADIDTWYNLYPDIQGIFLDEGPDDSTLDATAVERYTSYYDHVKELGASSLGAAAVDLNPGAAVNYASTQQGVIFDKIVSHENSTFPTARADAGEHEIALVHSQSTFDRERTVRITDDYSYIYVTDDNLSPNPWDSVSGYLTTLVQILQGSAQTLQDSIQTSVWTAIDTVPNGVDAAVIRASLRVNIDNPWYLEKPALTSYSVGSGLTITGNANYAGAVFTRSSEVFFVPSASTTARLFNYLTDTVRTVSIPGASQGRFHGGALLHSGKVVCVPLDARFILTYDPVDNSFTNTAISSDTSITYRGGCLLPSGKVFLCPFSAPSVGLYDPDADTVSDGAFVSSDVNKFDGCCLLPDGRVVMCPTNINQVGIYDPTADSYTGVTITTGSIQYVGCVYVPTINSVVFCPARRGAVGLLDVETLTFSNGPSVGSTDTDEKYAGAVLMGDGRVALVPHDRNNWGVFDAVKNTFTTIEAPTALGSSYYGGAVLPDGRVIAASHAQDNFAILSGGRPFREPEMCLHPMLNKL